MTVENISKINKRGGPNKVRGGWKKIEKLTSGGGGVYLAPKSMLLGCKPLVIIEFEYFAMLKNTNKRYIQIEGVKGERRIQWIQEHRKYLLLPPHFRIDVEAGMVLACMAVEGCVVCSHKSSRLAGNVSLSD